MLFEPGPLARQLYHLTWPMLIGLLAVLGCQLVDSAFIGQLGVLPLAVMGFSIPVYQLIIGLQVGLGIATTAIISTEKGAGDERYAEEFGVLVIITSLLLLAAVVLLLWFFQAPLLTLLGADADSLRLSRAYWFPWLISCWLGAMLHIFNSLFRAHGETYGPGMVMLLVSCINVLLDPLFIFTLDWGLAGAAWATCVAFVVGNGVLLWRLGRQRRVRWPRFGREQGVRLRRLLAFSGPATLSQFIPPVSAMAATAIVAGHGGQAVAAWGLGVRLEFVALIIVLALTMALPPLMGRLRGQGETEQIFRLVRLTAKFVLCWQLVIALLLFAGAAPIANLLSADEATAVLLAQFLWLVPISHGALGVCMILVSVCSALGMPRQALIISALRLFVCYLPLLWVGSAWGDLQGLFVGAMIGNLLAGAMSWKLYRRLAAGLTRRPRTRSLADQASPPVPSNSLCKAS